MSTRPTCPQCGGRIPEDAPAGLCPRCVVQIARGSRLRYFGDYELLGELGRGGMGVVFHAWQISLNRAVAVKVLVLGRLSSKEAVRRFHLEAEAAAQLQHPNIVAIHEIGEHEGQHFFSMDYIEGPSLAALVEKGPLAPERAARYVRIIAEAVEYAHQRGVVHRDLKPSNILIDASDQPHVTDFGLAKRLNEAADLTLSGQLLGSPGYMPPEQASAKRGKAGVTSDVYSLGAVLYHLLTGRAPFVGDDVNETVGKVLHEPPEPPRELNPEIPRDLESICLKCLQKDPQLRYEAASALAEDLARWQMGLPVSTRPLSLPARLWCWRGRRPAPTDTAALVISSVVFFGLVLLLGHFLLRHSEFHSTFRRTGNAAESRQAGLAADPRLSNLLGKVVFSYQQKEQSHYDLWWINADGTGLANLTQTPDEDEFEPVVSPDGRYVAFAVVGHSPPTLDGIYIQELAGPGKRQLVNAADYSNSEAFCPLWLNSTTILFTATTAVGRSSAYRVSTLGGAAQVIFAFVDALNLGSGAVTDVAPDRSRLLVCAQTGTWAPSLDVYAVGVDGKHPVVLHQDQLDERRDPVAKWSPRGDQVAFSHWLTPGAYHDPEHMGVAVVRTNGSGFQVLTPDAQFCHLQAWSPDGARLLFLKSDYYADPAAHTANTGNLWVMDANGSNQVQLTHLDGWFPMEYQAVAAGPRSHSCWFSGSKSSGGPPGKMPP